MQALYPQLTHSRSPVLTLTLSSSLSHFLFLSLQRLLPPAAASFLQRPLPSSSEPTSVKLPRKASTPCARLVLLRITPKVFAPLRLLLLPHIRSFAPANKLRAPLLPGAGKLGVNPRPTNPSQPKTNGGPYPRDSARPPALSRGPDPTDPPALSCKAFLAFSSWHSSCVLASAPALFPPSRLAHSLGPFNKPSPLFFATDPAQLVCSFQPALNTNFRLISGLTTPSPTNLWLPYSPQSRFEGINLQTLFIDTTRVMWQAELVRALN